MAIEEIAAKVGIGAAHWFMRTLSVVCVLFVIGGLVWSVYVTVVRPTTKPNPTTTEVQQGNITNMNFDLSEKAEEHGFFLGLRIFGIKLGIGK